MPFWTKKLPPRHATAPSLFPSHPMAETFTPGPVADWKLALLLVVHGYGAADCADADAAPTATAPDAASATASVAAASRHGCMSFTITQISSQSTRHWVAG